MNSAATRTPDEWAMIITRCGLDQKMSAKEIGNRVLGDLVGYRFSSKHRPDDAENLGNLILAAMKLGGSLKL